jgi:DNA-binding NarL/FixJ family response regulator
VKRARVLIADDHPAFRQALTEVLELTGFDVVGQAADGTDAVLLARRMVPDLVLIDLSMPVLNGLDTARLLRETLPATRVVVLTAFDSGELEQAALDAGASAYLVKGANVETVEATLTRVMSEPTRAGSRAGRRGRRQRDGAHPRPPATPHHDQRYRRTEDR